MPTGNSLRIVGRGLLQRVAQADDVATLAHRHPQRDHLAALVPDLDLGWVHITTPDIGDVTQLEAGAVGADGKVLELLDGVELAGHTHLHKVGRGVDLPGRLNRILLGDLGQHGVEIQAQLGEAALGDVDEQFFVLRAEDLDLVDVGHLEQALAHGVGLQLQVGIAEAIGRQRIDRTIDVAELVVVEGADNAAGQAAPRVADLLAHRVPDLRHLLGWRGVLDLEDDQRLTGLGVAADLVGVGHLLQRALQLVGDLVGHLLRRGAWPVGANDHGAEGERRVFVLPQLEVGRQTQQHQHHQQVARECRVLDGPAGDVERVGGRAHRVPAHLEAARAAGVAATGWP